MLAGLLSRAKACKWLRHQATLQDLHVPARPQVVKQAMVSERHGGHGTSADWATCKVAGLDRHSARQLAACVVWAALQGGHVRTLTIDSKVKSVLHLLDLSEGNGSSGA